MSSRNLKPQKKSSSHNKKKDKSDDFGALMQNLDYSNPIGKGTQNQELPLPEMNLQTELLQESH